MFFKTRVRRQSNPAHKHFLRLARSDKKERNTQKLLLLFLFFLLLLLIGVVLWPLQQELIGCQSLCLLSSSKPRQFGLDTRQFSRQNTQIDYSFSVTWFIFLINKLPPLRSIALTYCHLKAFCSLKTVQCTLF